MSSEQKPSRNYYEVLEVAETATDDQIKRAYKQLAQQYHPDKVPSHLTKLREDAAEKIKEISQAKDVLTDPDRRRLYDQELRLLREQGAVSQRTVGFPDEAFPCPHCGQMLGSSVRVCVACRELIDPTQIRVAAAAPAAVLPRAGSVPKARFSWGIFLVALFAWMAVATSMIRIVGFEKAQYVMAAMLVLSAAWVFLDARQKGFPRPYQWGAGALLFWIVFFPWYLARRRQPEASCPIVEAGTGPFLRVLFLILAFGLGIMLLLSAIASRLPNLPK